MEARTTTHDLRNAIGAAGEQAVRERVAAAGWRIVDHNVRWREGELDLIALDRSTLVFAEVKTLRARSGAAPFSPFESIGPRKQNQIRMLARRWLVDESRRMNLQQGRFSAFRFDAFAVTLGPSGEVLEFEHLEDAF
ncbi:MAG: YraN family protein [Solirubrobacterales bacterium]